MATPRSSGARRFSAIFDRSREPVFLLGPGGEFAYVNRAWETLAGRPAESVVGRAWPDAEPGGDASFRPPAEALAGRPTGGPALIARPDGYRAWHRVEFLPFRDEGGDLIGMLGLVRDAESPALAVDSESRRRSVELAEAREALRLRFGHSAIVGKGPRHLRTMEQVATAASVASPATIVGEPGTGRRLAARVIHERGPSRGSPFLMLDAAALTPGSIDREVLAAGGTATLAIVEPERMPRDSQARLMAILPDSRPRILAISETEPEAAIADGRLREDFGYALSPLVLRLPPLRDRVDEVPLLAQHFLERASRGLGRGPSCIEAAALDVLALYDWPGNIAELERVVASAIAVATGDRVSADDLPAAIRGELASAFEPPPMPSAVTPLDTWLAMLETRMIERALARARRNKSRAAELLDISRPRLYRRMKELGIADDGEPVDLADGKDLG